VLDVWFYKLRRRHGFRYARVTPDKKLFRQSFYVNRFVIRQAGRGSVAALRRASWRGWFAALAETPAPGCHGRPDAHKENSI